MHYCVEGYEWTPDGGLHRCSQWCSCSCTPISVWFPSFAMLYWCNKEKREAAVLCAACVQHVLVLAQLMATYSCVWGCLWAMSPPLLCYCVIGWLAILSHIRCSALAAWCGLLTSSVVRSTLGLLVSSPASAVLLCPTVSGVLMSCWPPLVLNCWLYCYILRWMVQRLNSFRNSKVINILHEDSKLGVCWTP